jgi:4-hydroxy-tetrahydrodipicolinate reductase
MMHEKIRVIQYGLGPIGCGVARLINRRPNLELVGGVDIDPDKVGKDLGEVFGLDHQIGVPVVKDLSQVASEADIVTHTTSSFFPIFKDQILDILESGYDIVSTSEELSFPWIEHVEGAEEIDSAAKACGKTVLSTGVNPGFLMDSLPLNLTAICEQVDRMEVTRVINASVRRGPFQAKIGTGMTMNDFEKKMAEGQMGHIGLPESMGMIFDTLGKELLRYEDSVEPIVAEGKIKTDYYSVQEGEVIGLKQIARGFSKDGEFLTLTFIAALDEENDGDKINIYGLPDLEIQLRGTNGDIATAAITVNAIPRVVSASPGLITMRDVPMITCR